MKKHYNFAQTITENELSNEYAKIEKEYTKLDTHLILDNIKVVNRITKKQEKEERESINFTIRNKAIIPYVQPDPKTNFLTVSHINLWTEDDPILRFMPNIRTDKPTRIMWYEGSEIGEKPMGIKNVVDQVFLHQKEYSTEAYKFLQLPEENKKTKNMKSLFCNVCLLFNCGIHKISPGKCIHFEEETKCTCWAINDVEKKREKSVKEIMQCIKVEKNSYVERAQENNSSFLESLQNNNSAYSKCRSQSAKTKHQIENSNNECEEELNANEDVKNMDDATLLKHLFCLNLKSCVLKKIVNVMSKYTFDCGEILSKKLPKKDFEKSYKEIVFMEHFTPCKHTGPCTKKNCSCAKKDIHCELSCFCTGCKQIKFCSCTGICDEKCTCSAHNRFCDPELCGCSCAKCSNLFTTEYKKSSVFRSPFHGFGLYCEEDLIKKDDYVMEYVGEIISDKEAERRGNFYEANNCSYLFNQVNENGECLYSLDAFKFGNKSRYINHSTNNANLRTCVMVDKGITKIIFKAKRDIYKGEEFLFNYQYSDEAQRKHGMVVE